MTAPKRDPADLRAIEGRGRRGNDCRYMYYPRPRLESYSPRRETGEFDLPLVARVEFFAPMEAHLAVGGLDTREET